MSESTPSGPCREKYWSELDSEARIERLRTVAKRLESRIDRALNTLARVERITEKHQHGKNGKVLVPVGNERGNCAEIGREPPRGPGRDDCYL